MFCGNCGKEIENGTRFCPYCGEEQTAVVIPAASIPVSATITEPNGQTAEPPLTTVSVGGITLTGTPINDAQSGETPAADASIAPEIFDTLDISDIQDEPVMTSMGIQNAESAPKTENAAASTSAAPAAPSSIPRFPTPNAIPTSNINAPESSIYTVYTSPTAAKQTVSEAPYGEISVKDGKKRVPERKYSLKHIVMCLAIAAVMAVAAGIFAGLYFSVVT